MATLRINLSNLPDLKPNTYKERCEERERWRQKGTSPLPDLLMRMDDVTVQVRPAELEEDPLDDESIEYPPMISLSGTAYDPHGKEGVSILISLSVEDARELIERFTAALQEIEDADNNPYAGGPEAV